jgi:hypothetical protein
MKYFKANFKMVVRVLIVKILFFKQLQKIALKKFAMFLKTRVTLNCTRPDLTLQGEW